MFAKSWIGHTLDFESVFFKTCTEADFEEFTPGHDGNEDCTMGEERRYTRRMACSFCKNVKKTTDLVTGNKQCSCGPQDFKCAYGFYRGGGLDNPLADCVEDAAHFAELCKDDQAAATAMAYYTQVPGNKCKDGAGNEKRTRAYYLTPKNTTCADMKPVDDDDFVPSPSLPTRAELCDEAKSCRECVVHNCSWSEDEGGKGSQIAGSCKLPQENDWEDLKKCGRWQSSCCAAHAIGKYSLGGSCIHPGRAFVDKRVRVVRKELRLSSNDIAEKLQASACTSFFLGAKTQEFCSIYKYERCPAQGATEMTTSGYRSTPQPGTTDITPGPGGNPVLKVDSFAKYVSYNGTLGDGITGNVYFEEADDGSLKVNYDLTLNEPNAIGGLHIHTGKDCAAEAGAHWWDTAKGLADPWTGANGATYTSDANKKANGSYALASGYTYSDNIGHTVIIHAASGDKIACGILVDSSVITTPSPQPAASTGASKSNGDDGSGLGAAMIVGILIGVLAAGVVIFLVVNKVRKTGSAGLSHYSTLGRRGSDGVRAGDDNDL